jgi:hypothetical protein
MEMNNSGITKMLECQKYLGMKQEETELTSCGACCA